jgi:fucose permease
MNWLHSFWGIGATTGPAIMSLFLITSEGWRTGYIVIASIQASLIILLLVTLPLWKKFGESKEAQDVENNKIITNKEALKIPYVKLALISFIFFSATEQTTGLWSASYLVGSKGISPEIAARWAALFYGCITVGRIISGFISIKIKSSKLIRLGQIICLVGAVILMLPLSDIFSLIGIILLGLGTAPIFPAMLHDTPNRFGKAESTSIMGLQMAFAYIGSTLMPPVFGLLASLTSLKLYPYYIITCVLIMFIASEVLNNRISKRKARTLATITK